MKMAEREGFEPSVEVSPYTRLAGEHLRPTRSSLRREPETRATKEKNLPQKSNLAMRNDYGGGSRIRTHVRVSGNGFQDRRLQPLGHPSNRV